MTGKERYTPFRLQTKLSTRWQTSRNQLGFCGKKFVGVRWYGRVSFRKKCIGKPFIKKMACLFFLYNTLNNFCFNNYFARSGQFVDSLKRALLHATPPFMWQRTAILIKCTPLVVVLNPLVLKRDLPRQQNRPLVTLIHLNNTYSLLFRLNCHCNTL